MEEQKGPNKIIAGIVVVALIGAVTTGVIVWSGRDANQQTVSDDTNQTTRPTTSGSSKSDDGATSTGISTYKDGSYAVEGSYMTPGGKESIGVKVTLADGTITDATVTQKPISREAQTYQAAFVSGYKSQVVGKKINEISLSRVAGSSLTPNGFNSAIDTIKSQAEV